MRWLSVRLQLAGKSVTIFKKKIGKILFLFITQFLFVDMPILSYLFQYLNSKALNYHKR